MIKHLQYFTVFLLLLISTSCAIDKFERNEIENVNSENVWTYDGDNSILKKVIIELKSGEYAASLERRLSKNQVLWQESQFLLIDGKKRILVPFLSVDKENVIGILALVKDDKGKTTFDMTSRTQLATKNIKLPFWNKNIWMGYFMALDRNILDLKNGNPGLTQRQANDEKLSKLFGASTAKSLKECRQQFTGYYLTFYFSVELCDVTYNEYTTDCQFLGSTAVYVPKYEEVCWEAGQPAPQLPDPPTTPDPIIDPNTIPGSLHYNNMNFTEGAFKAYVNTETYSISSPVITNTYGQGCITKVKITTPVFTYDINIEQLISTNSSTPYYYIDGVNPSVTEYFSFWVDSTNTDHLMETYNNHFENSISVVEYEGQNRYKVNNVLQIIYVKYRIEINSHTGEILSISKIQD
ncbi:MAG TPA: hypothetical protein VJ780_08575 [Flavobacterium sp.]|nr:hypothetical protein [Flavobacterium sp.]